MTLSAARLDVPTGASLPAVTGVKRLDAHRSHFPSHVHRVNIKRAHLLRQGLLLLSLGLLAHLLNGCATPTRRAWQTICAKTPIVSGHTYSREELEAMNQVGAWQLSVEEINTQCQ